MTLWPKKYRKYFLDLERRAKEFEREHPELTLELDKETGKIDPIALAQVLGASSVIKIGGDSHVQTRTTQEK